MLFLVIISISMFLEVVRFLIKASETGNATTLDGETHRKLDDNKEDQ